MRLNMFSDHKEAAGSLLFPKSLRLLEVVVRLAPTLPTPITSFRSHLTAADGFRVNEEEVEDDDEMSKYESGSREKSLAWLASHWSWKMSQQRKIDLNHMNLEMFDKSLSVAVKMNRNTIVVPIVMYIRQALNKRRLHPSNVTTVVYETSINYCNENTEHYVLLLAPRAKKVSFTRTQLLIFLCSSDE